MEGQKGRPNRLNQEAAMGLEKGETMKTIRYVTPDTYVDISMPSFLFWFFKKYAKIKTSKPSQVLSGLIHEVTFFDEAQP